MRILVTNDDGIMAPGLLALRRALAELGEVTVVAPTVAQSAVGHAITLTEPIRAHRMNLGDGLWGYGVQGSPADSVKLALLELLPERPDIVASGVNLGTNLGVNVLYSGTVAAAAEGAFFGLPSVAVSIEDSDVVDFDGAARIARRLIEQVMTDGPDRSGARPGEPVLLNINVPDLTSGEPKGVKVVPQSMKGFSERWERRTDPRGRTYYWITGDHDREDQGINSDIAAFYEGYVTVTPLAFDLTDHDRVADVRGWNLTL